MAVTRPFPITGLPVFSRQYQSYEVQLSTRGLYPDDNTLLGSKYFLYSLNMFNMSTV